MLKGYNNCSYCGSDTLIRKNEDHICCQGCDRVNYINYSTAAGCYLYDDNGAVLLAERGRDPWKGKYDDPGGFMDLADMCAEDTVVRELYEELGITIDKESLHYLGNATMIYHYKGRDIPICAIHFTGHINAEQIAHIQVNDDVAGVRWVTEDNFDDDMMSQPIQAVQVRKVFALAKSKKK